MRRKIEMKDQGGLEKTEGVSGAVVGQIQDPGPHRVLTQKIRHGPEAGAKNTILNSKVGYGCGGGIVKGDGYLSDVRV